MFSKIAAALNDQPESQHALCTSIDLARACRAELTTVSILGDLPAYTSFAMVVDPGAPNAMKEDRRRFQSELHERASKLAQEHGVHATGAIVEGREVHTILGFLKNVNADLLMIGLHQRLLSPPFMEFRL
jgi:nucleotide-binding universal stress UspA family protein